MLFGSMPNIHLSTVLLFRRESMHYLVLNIFINRYIIFDESILYGIVYSILCFMKEKNYNDNEIKCLHENMVMKFRQNK